MSDFSEISKVLTNLKEMRNSVKFQLRHPLEGKIIISNNARGVAYYRETYADGKRNLKSINRKEGLVYRLANQRYLEEQLERIEYDINLLERLQKEFCSLEYEDILGSLPKNFKFLQSELVQNPGLLKCSDRKLHPIRDGSVMPRCLSTSISGVSLQEWMYAPYCENTSHLEHKTQISASGCYVRSKSEAGILGLYEEKRICHHYDELLRVPGGYISPDFHGVTDLGKVIIHEHVGDLSSSQYASRHYEKLEIYKANGFEQGRNLLLTFDDEYGNINLSLISAMIDDIYGL